MADSGGLTKNAAAENLRRRLRTGYCSASEKTLIASDATALLRTATVVWDWSHIGNRCDTDTQGTQRTNRRLTARAGTFDFNVEVLDALLHRCTTGHFRSHLSGKGSGLA
jgi:hypothetical protein